MGRAASHTVFYPLTTAIGFNLLVKRLRAIFIYAAKQLLIGCSRKILWSVFNRDYNRTLEGRGILHCHLMAGIYPIAKYSQPRHVSC